MLPATLVVGGVVFSSPAFAQPPGQAVDPFGAPVGAQPDPFASPVPHPNDPFTPPAGKPNDPFAAPTGKPANPLAANKPVTTYVPSSGNKDVERQIEQALQTKASVSFVETPLEECVKTLAEEHQIPILIDVRSLEEIGLSQDVPVSLNIQNISLRSCLRLMLSKLDLTYILQDEVLQVTTLEHAENQLKTVVYRLDNTGLKADDARQLITRSIDSDTWEVLGGPSSIQAMASEDEQHHLLVVSTTRITHERIADLLQRFATENLSGLKLLESAASRLQAKPPSKASDTNPGLQ